MAVASTCSRLRPGACDRRRAHVDASPPAHPAGAGTRTELKPASRTSAGRLASDFGQRRQVEPAQLRLVADGVDAEGSQHRIGPAQARCPEARPTTARRPPRAGCPTAAPRSPGRSAGRSGAAPRPRRGRSAGCRGADAARGPRTRAFPQRERQPRRTGARCRPVPRGTGAGRHRCRGRSRRGPRSGRWRLRINDPSARDACRARCPWIDATATGGATSA
jgi:hypothetical protein